MITFSALWPAGLSYVVCYCFIAMMWLAHNHLFRFSVTLANFMVAMLVSRKFPSHGLGLICCTLLLYRALNAGYW